MRVSRPERRNVEILGMVVGLLLVLAVMLVIGVVIL
jgi:hypothetical protein